MKPLKRFTCINCPAGCLLTVKELPGGSLQVDGNSCREGLQYGKEEFSDPRRIVTGTIKIWGGILPVLPVRTTAGVPRDRVRALYSSLRSITAEAPVYCGQIILQNVGNTKADLVATRDLPVKPDKE
jgi:CxxC motif-containing protein